MKWVFTFLKIYFVYYLSKADNQVSFSRKNVLLYCTCFLREKKKTGCGPPLFVKCSAQEIGMSGQWPFVSRRAEAASKPRSEHIPKRVSSFRRSESPSSLQDMDGTDFGGSSGSYSFNHGPPPSYSQAGMHAACGVSLLALSLALWVSCLFFFCFSLFFKHIIFLWVFCFFLFLFSIQFCSFLSPTLSFSLI